MSNSAGTDSEMHELGLLELDVLQVVVSDSTLRFRRMFSPSCKKLKDDILGLGVSHDGSTAFEKAGRANLLVAKDAATAWAYRPSRVDPALQMRGEIVKFFIEVGVRVMQKYAPQIFEQLKANHELHNLPMIGHSLNYCFAGVQLNMANAVSWESHCIMVYSRLVADCSSLGEGLGREMHFFGGEHTDKNDFDAGLSGIFASPDIPSDYEGGRFHFLELGCYIRLSGTVCALFSGLRHHGGTPPRAPRGQPVEKWARRLVIVLYPPASHGEGAGIYNLCAGGKQNPVRFTPEYADPELESHAKRLWSTEMTFAEDGPFIMPQEALVRFMGRATLQMALSYFRQLPLGWKVNINTTKYLESISYAIEGSPSGSRATLEPWPLAPSVQGQTPSETRDIDTVLLPPRLQVLRAFEEFRSNQSRFIPYVVDKSSDNVNMVDSPGLLGGRPKKYTSTTTKKPPRVTSIGSIGMRRRRYYGTVVHGKGTVRALFNMWNVWQKQERGKARERKRAAKKATILEEVEAIVDHCFDQEGRITYYVHWAGYDEDENTWEPLAHVLDGARTTLEEYHASVSLMLVNDTTVIPIANETSSMEGAGDAAAGSADHEAMMEGEDARMGDNNAGMGGEDAGMGGEDTGMGGHHAGMGEDDAEMAGDAEMEGEDTRMRGEDTVMRGHNAAMEGEDIGMEGEDIGMEGDSAPMGGENAPMGSDDVPMGDDAMMGGTDDDTSRAAGSEDANARPSRRRNPPRGRQIEAEEMTDKEDDVAEDENQRHDVDEEAQKEGEDEDEAQEEHEGEEDEEEENEDDDVLVKESHFSTGYGFIDAITRPASIGAEYQSAQVLQTLARFHQDLAKHPGALSTLQGIRRTWKDLQIIDNDSAVHQALVYVTQECLLQPGMSPSWLGKLISDIQNALAPHTTLSPTFDSAVYLPDLLPSHTYTHTLSRRQYKALTVEECIPIVVGAIQTWLEFPTDDTSTTQDFMLRLIHKHVPLELVPTLFLLPSTWAAFKNPKLAVIHSETLSHPHPSCHTTLPFVRTISAAERRSRLHFTVASSTVLMDPIVTFLEELLPLLDEEESDEDSNTAETGRTELQQFVMEDEDYFLPFRELLLLALDFEIP
ncbi:hypothetical protein BDZ89DRAFT_1137611 [Hymenopellis radicata]|nr:hypothetical protein BDZ89DRAFT_1137611 [Hymenopellis radicata]